MELDEIKIQHSLPGRVESPILERTVRLSIEAAMRDLLENKLLYQKVEVDLECLETELRKAGVQTNAPRLNDLRQEISRRPWKLETRHFGDDPATAEIYRCAATGGQPVGTPLDKMNLHFYAPSIALCCKKCRRSTTFVAIIGSSEQRLGNPYPRKTDKGTEQVYTITYRCEVCRDILHAALVRREGLRLHLCGFAPRREQGAQRTVPKALSPILLDADNAVAEGDLFAGYYHLRTMLEHFMKDCVGIPIVEQMRGDELVSRYNATLPDGLKETLPSLKSAYEKLSQALHGRCGSNEDYTSQHMSICDHLEGVALLRKYQAVSAPKS